VRGNLKNNPDGVNDATSNDGRATTEVISKITRNDRTKEGSRREDGNDEGVVRSRESGRSIGLDDLDEDT